MDLHDPKTGPGSGVVRCRITRSLTILAALIFLSSECSSQAGLESSQASRAIVPKVPTAIEASDDCSTTPCSCVKLSSGSDIRADCSGRNITRIPSNLPIHIVILNFSNNALSSLEDDDLIKYIDLRVIDLSFNRIANLSRNSLLTALKLEYLHLNDNYLSFNSYYSLPTNVFDNLTFLIALKLHNNPRDRKSLVRPKEYRDDLFLQLASLQCLTIDGIPSANFSEGFSKLVRLKYLEIHNELTVITNETFKWFSAISVERLNIKTGKFLQILEPESFAHFRKLDVLDLSNNVRLDLTKVSIAWYGLLNTTISELILSNVGPVGLISIGKSFYDHPIFTQIQRLALDRNEIVKISPDLFKYLSNLTHLDVSYNRLSNDVSLLVSMPRMRSLKWLDMSYQIKRYQGQSVSKRHVRDATTATSKTNSMVLGLSEDRSSCQPQTVPFGNYNTGSLCPNFALRKNETYDISNGGAWCFILPPQLETVNLSACINVDITFMPPIIALGGNKLKELVYRDNGISFLAGPIIIGAPNPTIPLSLDLSGNGLECISPDVLKWTIQKRGALWRKLALSNNKLNAQLEQDVNGDVFKYYSNLSELYLDRNGITSLPARIFVNLSAIEILNLSRNSMRMLEFDFSHMKKLRYLDISNNLFRSLDANILNKLDQHRVQTSNMTINFYGNPIQCSCDSLSFLEWMQKSRGLFADFSRYSCANMDEKFDVLENKILVELRLKCSSTAVLWTSASLLGLAIISVFLSVIVYRHRWDIRYYLLRLRNGRRGLIELEERSKRYKYDAFVIYDHRDVRWVRYELDVMIGQEIKMCAEEELTPFVIAEEQAGVQEQERFRFCIHDREFVAGDGITESIISSMLNSRKVVLVMSSHLITSNWCMYELEMAICQNVERGFNTIVPIMLEPLDDISVMSSNMQQIMRSLTYIQWPEDELERPQFWRKLQNALRQH